MQSSCGSAGLEPDYIHKDAVQSLALLLVKDLALTQVVV